MSVELLDEELIRAALRPLRADPAVFAAGVQQRMAVQAEQAADPAAHLPPLARAAATWLPVSMLAGTKLAGVSAKAAGSTFGSKLLGIAILPAVSLFLLIGAAVLSVVNIRRAQSTASPQLGNELELNKAQRDWWSKHTYAWTIAIGLNIGLSMLGATWLLYLLYILSFGVLLYLITSMARQGLGNRVFVANSCAMGLIFLGQTSMFSGVGDHDILLIDPKATCAVFFIGALILIWIPARIRFKLVNGYSKQDPLTGAVVMTVILIPLTLWLLSPYLWPKTPQRIKAWVESFDRARFSTASWHQWEIAARWAAEQGLEPDLSAPRRLLQKEIEGKQNPFILATAFRVGMIKSDEISQLREYKQWLESALAYKDFQEKTLWYQNKHVDTPALSSSGQYNWVIRAAMMRGDLTEDDKDHLERRLLSELQRQNTPPADALDTALEVTQLLQVIDRPIDVDKYRPMIHRWLSEFHATRVGMFERAGGFRKYTGSLPGSLDTTAHGIELMETFGWPADMNLDWLRSFLRPEFSVGAQPYIAAVARDRLEQLPGAQPPSWWTIMYYQRSLLAAIVLVVLCIYATLISPVPKTVDAATNVA